MWDMRPYILKEIIRCFKRSKVSSFQQKKKKKTIDNSAAIRASILFVLGPLLAH